jgi:hypothetical protein
MEDKQMKDVTQGRELRRNDKYILIDTRFTVLKGSYQVLEVTQESPSGETCGIYFNKKDAIRGFNRLSNGG